MTITFYSNFLNHHQLYFCQQLIEIIGEGNFHFVATMPIASEQLTMGYVNMNEIYPFVIKAYDNNDEYSYALKLANDSDVVIIGAAPSSYISERLNYNKLTFRFSERLFKNGTWHRFLPSTYRSIYKSYLAFKQKSLYVLCASAYLAEDLALVGFPKAKCFKWGYFPKAKVYKESVINFKSSSNTIELLWVGRMIWWKHPEDAIYTLDYLLKSGIQCHLTMIGQGKKRKEVEKFALHLGITEKVTFRDFCSEQEVRCCMERANIYIFSSGREEGWGAVLNEAMNSGCMVVANRCAGSTPYLIQNKKNGLIYDGSRKELRKCLDIVIKDQSLITTMGEEAYNTIVNTWNYRVAAHRFVKLSKSFINGQEQNDISFGPCSYV
ncbi:glycosyltransferase [Phocaeicola vulgatus]|nr:glycosyltransferase [Phocaeicola vulgatus]